ncbi:MAG: hypothetical protein NZ853_09260 [Leptospiraceae bacterium]|nr:hypothetical protein [Leptospiraceae bacterium]MDW7975617.1 hypothetical protein [Leptospiraceae bacterium]
MSLITETNREDQDFLIKILNEPFTCIYELPTLEKETISPLIETPKFEDEYLFVEEKRIVRQFSHPIEVVLRPHIYISNEIFNKINIATKNLKVRRIFEQYGSDFIEKLESIRKFYRLLIETNTDEQLEKEAQKLGKRFFGESFNENQKNFIKMKRFIERLKSFHEVASNNWKDIEKLIDTFLFIQETKEYFKDIQEYQLQKILILNHQTEVFLNLLEKYLRVQGYQQSSPYNYIASLSYDENIQYTLTGLYNSLTLETQSQSTQKLELNSLQEIAKTIIFDSEIKKFQKNLLSTRILGSKNWNRTLDYFLEVKRDDYQKDMELFYHSHHVVFDDKTLEESYFISSYNSTPLNPKNIDEILSGYLSMLRKTFEEIRTEILQDDFKGILKPDIFFYHIGANTIFQILMEKLREKKWGEILYFDSNLLIRKYPNSLIKKIFIDWWEEIHANIDQEEVDAYTIYVFQQEIVLQEYIKDYEQIKKAFEKTHKSHFEFDRWFHENHKEVLKTTKFYIYKRFYPSLLIDFKKLFPVLISYS